MITFHNITPPPGRSSGEEVARATDFLSQCRPLKHPNKTIGTVGHLKHWAEKWHARRGVPDPYISPGSFIAAAVFLGIPIAWDQDRPATWIGIDSRDVRRLVREARKARLS